MKIEKTETQIFIETLAGFARAIAELDQVAKIRGGDELQREAYKACLRLDSTLKDQLAGWNNEGDEEHPRIVECKWYDTAACEVYTAEALMCLPCAALKSKHEAEDLAA
jgi:hypothetical protein